MKLQRGTRGRLAGALLAGIAAVAILSLPGLASSHKRGHGPPPPAGVIESYDSETGALAVDLTDGGTISALVVDRTHIRCGKPHRRGHHRGRGHGRASKRPHRGADMPAAEGEGRGPRDEGSKGGEGPPPGHDGTPPGASEGPGKGAERSGRCGTDDLVPGTVVKKAEIVLINGNAYYRVVCLPRPDNPSDEEPEPGPGDEEEG